MWEVILKMAQWLRSLAVSPLAIEVLSFSMDETINRPGDSLVFITPYPRRYFAELLLTNRSDKTVYVKSIELSAASGEVYREPEEPGAVKLAPGEPKPYDAIFPLGDTEQPVRGRFKIIVRPAVGRKAKCRTLLR